MGLRVLWIVLGGTIAIGCGAKTGLLVPDAEVPMDQGIDSGPDFGPLCMPTPVVFDQPGAELLFIIDRSTSMEKTLDDRTPLPGEPNRWLLLADALANALDDTDELLSVGAKFYPAPPMPDPNLPPNPEDYCVVDTTDIDLLPRRNNAEALLQVFVDSEPEGGTPTALALDAARVFYDGAPSNDEPRFVVLATDGGPNCNATVDVPCDICTGTDDRCDPDNPFGPYNCLDENRTQAVIRDLFEDRGIPVYVIGIDDPTRTDLGDVLDRMAISGGRPRNEPGERRYYNVQEPDDLTDAFGQITDTIARCNFELPIPPADGALLEVRLDDVAVSRDRSRSDGWDFTTPERSALTLYGSPCRVAGEGAEVTMTLLCPAER